MAALQRVQCWPGLLQGAGQQLVEEEATGEQPQQHNHHQRGHQDRRLRAEQVR